MNNEEGRTVPIVLKTQVVVCLSDIEQDYYRVDCVRTRIDKERTHTVWIVDFLGGSLIILYEMH